MFTIKPSSEYRKINYFLSEYMKGHNGFIAGGVFKNIFTDEKIRDVDIFFKSEQDRVDAEKYYENNLNYVFSYENNNVVAYKHKLFNVTVELIKKIYGTPEEIIQQFDFTISKMAYYTESVLDENLEEHIEHKIMFHQDFFEHLFLKRTVIDDKILFPTNTFERIIKYTRYGYYPCRETKKKILLAINELENIPDISRSLYDGID